MVLYTIINEYDILYAQERELRGEIGAFSDKPDKPCENFSTDPADYLAGTALSPFPPAVQAVSAAENILGRKGRK